MLYIYMITSSGLDMDLLIGIVLANKPKNELFVTILKPVCSFRFCLCRPQ